MLDNKSSLARENLIPNKRIIELKPGDKNLDLCFILVQLKSRNKLKNDLKITQFLVADESGSILCNFFDDVGLKLQEGDIIFLKGCYASVFKGHLILYASRPGYGQVIKMGEFFMIYNDSINLSERNWLEIEDEKTGMKSFRLEE